MIKAIPGGNSSSNNTVTHWSVAANVSLCYCPVIPRGDMSRTSTIILEAAVTAVLGKMRSPEAR